MKSTVVLARQCGSMFVFVLVMSVLLARCGYRPDDTFAVLRMSSLAALLWGATHRVRLALLYDAARRYVWVWRGLVAARV